MYSILIDVTIVQRILELSLTNNVVTFAFLQCGLSAKNLTSSSIDGQRLFKVKKVL